jgi:beta-phosphoglucomutase
MSRAVLWDVDGTLIDSSEYHWLSWHETLAAESFPLSREEFAAVFGWRNDEILRRYFGEDFPADQIARIGDAKEDLYRQIVRKRGVSLLPGCEKWLKKFKADGWLQAMASSAPRLNLMAITEVLNLSEYFDAVVSAEDVARGKPDPQVFLAAAAKLKVEPRNCVVIEDAPVGTEAARRAGMHCVGILTLHPKLQADIVVRTLEELPDDAFRELLKSGYGTSR